MGQGTGAGTSISLPKDINRFSDALYVVHIPSQLLAGLLILCLVHFYYFKGFTLRINLWGRCLVDFFGGH